MAMVEQRNPRHPESGEYDDYYRGYVEKVPAGDVVEFMASQ